MRKVIDKSGCSHMTSYNFMVHVHSGLCQNQTLNILRTERDFFQIPGLYGK